MMYTSFVVVVLAAIITASITTADDKGFIKLMTDISKNPAYKSCGDIQGITDINDDKFLCFFKCTAEHSGLLTSAGEPNANGVADLIVPEDIKDKITVCMSKAQKVNTCADMKQFINCYP